ncbi:hypothetical protein [Aeromonas enteropelogenes]|uniref:hypothetical protein n=1 Tax=Aeromonas enteropelogenes TaxID=29489 RepID=UPI0038CFFADF
MFVHIKLSKLFLLLGMFFTPSLLAKPELYLLFHMGTGANGQFFVGGTLENRGDQEVYQGYVVITLLTEECYPLKPVLSQFGVIKAGAKYEFRIPIEGSLKGYKLDTLYATDSFANPVTVIDETAAILADKQKAYLARCQQARE